MNGGLSISKLSDLNTPSLGAAVDRDGDGAAGLGRRDGRHVEGGAVVVARRPRLCAAAAAAGSLIVGGKQRLDVVDRPESGSRQFVDELSKEMFSPSLLDP